MASTAVELVTLTVTKPKGKGFGLGLEDHQGGTRINAVVAGGAGALVRRCVPPPPLSSQSGYSTPSVSTWPAGGAPAAPCGNFCPTAAQCCTQQHYLPHSNNTPHSSIQQCIAVCPPLFLPPPLRMGGCVGIRNSNSNSTTPESYP
jgi:hypothetical protein